MESESGSSLVERLKPYVAVISMQFGYAGMNIISMIALKQGMSHFALVVYRHAVATAVLFPLAILFERKVRPKMTFSTLWKILVLGLIEPVIDQNLYYTGMKYTSATFTAAMCNMLPALTFILAYFFRLEKVNIKKVRSQAKVVGTLVTVGGAMLMTLYRGPIIEMVWSKGRNHGGPQSDVGANHDWVKGALMLTAGCFCWACFVILQAFALRTYPAELSLTALICLAGTVEGTVVALVIERDNFAIWYLGWNAKLFASVYGGIICSGIGYYVQGAIMKKRGPVFVTAFSPLSMIIVAILGSIILAEEISLGRVLGAIIIVTGLYFVVWGKGKDHIVSSPSIDEPRSADKQLTATINSSKMDHRGSDNIIISPPSTATAIDPVKMGPAGSVTITVS